MSRNVKCTENLEAKILLNEIECGKLKYSLELSWADLNAKSTAWGPRSDPRGEALLNFFDQHNLDVLNDPDGPPTYNSVLGQSWIDLFVSNIEELKHYRVHDKISCSDHELITVDIIESDYRLRAGNTNIRYERLDWIALRVRLRDIISTYNLEPVNAVEQLDTSIIDITKDIVAACRASVLRQNIKRGQHCSWWHPGLSQKLREVRALRRRYQKTTDEQERASFKIRFKQQLAVYKKEIRKAKALDLRKFLDRVNEDGAFSAPYKIAKGDNLRPTSHCPR
ncbi:uncharacterized protein [Parasteatoda tepidariorum]|uniref:uncharacterized protein n=1 Tax=Parasteatoda tepidariorum TaxID=114398 RepID=UPI001C7198E2|nr:uncharacterized protein LOC122271391 [Parasteatoda tepidariorum]